MLAPTHVTSSFFGGGSCAGTLVGFIIASRRAHRFFVSPARPRHDVLELVEAGREVDHRLLMAELRLSHLLPPKRIGPTLLPLSLIYRAPRPHARQGSGHHAIQPYQEHAP